MSLTLAQIQQNITNKGDVREILNQLADFLEANPGGGSGVGVESIVLQSPDDTLWLIGVSNSGALQTAQIAEGVPGELHLFSTNNTEWNVTITDEGALVTTVI